MVRLLIASLVLNGFILQLFPSTQKCYDLGLYVFFLFVNAKHALDLQFAKGIGVNT
jgi:hypothetical protein